MFMMTIEELNEKLKNKGLRVYIAKMYNYDTNTYKYDASIDYLKKDGRWGIYHVLGVFTKKSEVINKALHKLQIDKIL